MPSIFASMRRAGTCSLLTQARQPAIVEVFIAIPGAAQPRHSEFGATEYMMVGGRSPASVAGRAAASGRTVARPHRSARARDRIGGSPRPRSVQFPATRLPGRPRRSSRCRLSRCGTRRRAAFRSGPGPWPAAARRRGGALHHDVGAPRRCPPAVATARLASAGCASAASVRAAVAPTCNTWHHMTAN
jgi:hypothetical protein